MMKENHMKQVGSKSYGGFDCSVTAPKVNWLQHANAHDNFYNQNEFLSSNFLYSLSAQKPCGGGTVAARSMTCCIDNVQLKPQVEKAWQVLSSFQLSCRRCRTYVRPGITATIVEGVSASSSQDVRRATQQQRASVPNKNFSGHTGTSSNFGENNAKIDQSTRCFVSTDVIEARKVLSGLNEGYASGMDNSHGRIVNESLRSDTTDAIQRELLEDTFVSGIDDDEILKTIDLDQIVMEHYQSTRTIQPSISELPLTTPTASKGNGDVHEGTFLATELCWNCNHGFKLGLCPEAANHLQEMKDKLIAISNELLDNIADPSPEQLEKLRQDRLHLNRQIQLLEKHLPIISGNLERQKSHFAASTATPKAFQYETPPIVAFRTYPIRFDSEVQIRNESGGYERCNSSLCSFSSVDGFGVSLGLVEREPYILKYGGVTYIEGSNDKQWSSLDFPWTKQLEASNKRVFGLHSFRPNQREIINATMSGYDVFVLMPTGGGKSLTYQLPSLICPGITLVISPLVSLIQDQIMHLLQANIAATCLSANMEWDEQQEILRELSSDDCKYKLLYVTPEKVAKEGIKIDLENIKLEPLQDDAEASVTMCRSDVLLRNLESLHARESLARIVIDEAHCVSQWGHDFRPDYQGLGILKQKFPKTPVLALTATATTSVKEDVVQALGLVNCIIFRQSFNRPNLRYSVLPKTKKCVEDIDNFIKEFHFDECGIIYCLSRMDCEKVAEKLQECGHKAAFYHGSMDPANRAFVQKQWSKDEINIICATVAFGMGINKPDVRFVIHHSLAKSIEGYHQECGRAGRDGQNSSCLLYYSYGDYIRVKNMLSHGVGEQSSSASGYNRVNTVNSGRVLETNTENLLRMVSYCENNVDCRRLLQLIHFGEKFNSVNCRKTCDNCTKIKSLIEKDVTEIAKQLIELVKSTRQQFSSAHILEVYRGSMNQLVKKHRHDMLRLHGAGKHLAKDDTSRILHHLVVEDFLVEKVKKSDIYGSVSSVLKVNQSKVNNLFAGGQTIKLRFPSSVKASKASKSGATTAKRSLTSGKHSLPQMEAPTRPQPEVNLNLSAKLYSALRMLMAALTKEAGDNVMGYHIFGNAVLQRISKRIPRTKKELLQINGVGKVKVSKYGKRILETIKATIVEHKTDNKNNSSGNDVANSVKRRRGDTENVSYADLRDEDYLIESTGRSKKKRVMNKQNESVEVIDDSETEYYNLCEDVDLDIDEFYDG